VAETHAPLPDLSASDLLVQINNAHGVAVESNHVVKSIADHIRNNLAAVAGRAQSAVNRATSQAKQKIAKRLGQARGAVDGAVEQMSGDLYSRIETAAIPVVDAGGELPGPTMIAVAKSQLPTLAPFAPMREMMIPPHSGSGGPPYPVICPPPPVTPPGICARPVADPAIPPPNCGYEFLPCPTLPGGGGGGGGGDGVCPPGMILGPGGQCIENICPPCPPPCPADGCTWTVWHRPCLEYKDTVCYAIPSNMNPLGPNDRAVVSIPDSQGGPVCRAIIGCNKDWRDMPKGDLVCGPPKPGAGGGGVGAPMPPPAGCQMPPPNLGPDGCPICPPGFHWVLGPQGGMVCVQDQPGDEPCPIVCPPGQVCVKLPDGTWSCMSYQPPPPSHPDVPPDPYTPPPPYPIFTPPGTFVNVNLALQLPEEVFPPGKGAGGPDVPNVPAPGNICHDWDIWAQQWQGKDCYELAAELKLNNFQSHFGELQGNWGLFAFIPYIWARVLVFGRFVGINLFVAWCVTTDRILSVACPDRGPLIYLALLRWSMTWLKRIAGVSDRKPEEQMQRMENYFCPTGTPTLFDANLAFVRGEIDQPTWECWVRMCNMGPSYANVILKAGRDMPSMFDYVNYWRRGKATEQELDKDLFQRGLIVSRDRDVLREVTTVLPPPTDLVRFMLRSIGDPAVVQRFQLEAEFDQLFQGRIKEWAKADGISEQVLRGYHAAHWDVPSPGDLAVFWQRYRTGRILNPALNLPGNMTDQDYDRALREQGIAPYWRPFYRAAQFGILGYRQLQYGYQFGKLDDVQLKEGYMDVGYPENTADIMVGITRERVQNMWMKDDIVKAYAKNGVNEDGIRTYLGSYNLANSMIDNIVINARRESGEVVKEKIVSQIGTAYATGQYDDSEARSRLQELQLDEDQVDRIISAFKDEKKVRPKPIAGAQICQWYTNKLITRDEATDRLLNSDYLPNDAELILQNCEMKFAQQQLRQYQQALKQMAAQERKQLKDLSAAERQAQLAHQREAKALARQIKDQNRTAALLFREASKAQQLIDRALSEMHRADEKEESKEKQLVRAYEAVGAKWWKKMGGDPPRIMAELVSAVTAAVAGGSVTAAELLQVAGQLLTAAPKGQWVQITSLVDLARTQVDLALAIGSGPSTNGNLPASESG